MLFESSNILLKELLDFDFSLNSSISKAQHGKISSFKSKKYIKIIYFICYVKIKLIKLFELSPISLQKLNFE